ncbi:hypothetical protein BBJ28_00017547 [Nothophytophthora sp. Chile5]|nr:hypothetical protein BBJ28_00017547 [Nothophytophthora sp. Chile5]
MAPPKPQARKFRPQWGLQFALAVAERDPASGAPKTVVCLMCRAFERDETVGAKRRKPKTRVQRFSPPWRPDNMRRHLEQQHAVRWGEYQALSEGEKRVFFPTNVPTLVDTDDADDAISTNVMTAVELLPQELLDLEPSAAVTAVLGQTRTFLIDRDIVDELVRGVLLNGSNGDRRGSSGNLAGFMLQEAEEGEDVDLNEARYAVHVDSLLQLNMCIRYISGGVSFKQAIQLIGAAMEGTPDLGDRSRLGSAITEKQVAVLCRVACSVNLQRIKDLLASGGVWAFAVALENGKNAGSPYLDVRLRFEQDGVLHNVHLIAIAIQEMEMDQQSDELVVRCLDVVAPEWKTQLIGVCCPDGSLNSMPQCVREIMDGLAQDCIAPVFYDSNAGQQLDRAVQKACGVVFDELFMTTLMGLTGHLRRQRTLILEMQGDTCPKFIDGSWQSVVKAMRWLVTNRTRVIQHLEARRPVCTPNLEWWITVIVVTSIADLVEATLAQLRTPAVSSSLATHERECLTKLVADLAMITGAMGPLLASQFFSISCDDLVGGAFALNRGAIVSFMKVQGNFASNAMDFLLQNQPATAQVLVDATGSFVLSVLGRIHHHLVESSVTSHRSSDCAVSAIPAFLPNLLCNVRHQDFVAVMKQQRLRLEKRFSADQIEKIEAQHRALRRVYQLEDHIRQRLDSLSTSASFGEAWQDGTFGDTDCRLLRSFCGALASAAPDVAKRAATEDEFALINWRKVPFTQSLTDFSLEAILHAQQYRSLACI